MVLERHQLGSLPAEILDNIGRWLPKSVLGNLRLSNRHCAAVLTQLLVRDIEVMHTLRSMQNLQHLSLHPTLCQYVRSVNYFSPVLEYMEENDVWQRIFDHLLPENEEWPTEVVEEVRRISKETQLIYRRLAMEQDAMDRDRTCSLTLAQAASRFTKLQEISVQTHCYDRTVRPQILAKVDKPPRAIDYDLFAEYDGYQQYQNKDTLHDIALMAAASESLETFKIYDVYWYSLNANPPLSLSPRAPFHSNLKNISLKFAPWISFFDGSGSEHEMGMQQELGKLLARATGLRSLILQFERQRSGRDLKTGASVPETIPILLENVLGSTTFEYLHRLEMSNMTSSYSMLVEYLERHASSLRTLSLHDLYLTDGEDGVYLHEILPSLHSSLRLEEARLTGMWGSARREDDYTYTMDMKGSEARVIEKWLVAKATSAFSDLAFPKIEKLPYNK